MVRSNCTGYQKSARLWRITPYHRDVATGHIWSNIEACLGGQKRALTQTHRVWCLAFPPSAKYTAARLTCLFKSGGLIVWLSFPWDYCRKLKPDFSALTCWPTCVTLVPALCWKVCIPLPAWAKSLKTKYKSRPSVLKCVNWTDMQLLWFLDKERFPQPGFTHVVHLDCAPNEKAFPESSLKPLATTSFKTFRNESLHKSAALGPNLLSAKWHKSLTTVYVFLSFLGTLQCMKAIILSWKKKAATDLNSSGMPDFQFCQMLSPNRQQFRYL